jgi:hypothetical protein
VRSECTKIVRSKHTDCAVINNKENNNTKKNSSSKEEESVSDSASHNPVETQTETDSVDQSINPASRKKKKGKFAKNNGEGAPDNNSQKKKVPKSKYKHTTKDYQWYMMLKKAGATNHRKGTKALNKTLDAIHSLASKNVIPIYSRPVHVPEQYIDHEWTIEELVETFKFQLKHAEKIGYHVIKNFGSFVLTKNYGQEKMWSPLLFWHQRMNKGFNSELTAEAKTLYKELEKKEVPEYNELSVVDLNRIAELLVELKKEYCLSDQQERTQHHFNGLFSVFADCMKRRAQKNRKFKHYWMVGDSQFQAFIEEAKKYRLIFKRRRR